MRKILLITTFILLLTGTAATGADIVIIAHSDVELDSIDVQTARSIFLGTKTRWDNGAKIIPAVLAAGLTHESFLKQVAKKTPSNFKIHWKKAVFTGTGTIPATFTTEEDMVKYISSTKGAIGYIAATHPHPNVKTIILTH